MFFTEGKYHFFFGDETGILFFDEARRDSCFLQKKYIGVLELEERYIHLPEQLGLLVDVVPHKGEAAEQSIHFLHMLEPELWDLWKEGTFHLAGRMNLVHHFHQALTKMGIPDERIITYSFTPVKRPNLSIKFPFSGL
jgi:hypothetical protein